ncbi:MAG: beta-phosphoglucomutase [Desulfobulbus propionicus]|nr:MAG: beta-phosphoglucomutase [Desulfobulbus propionicus]
MQDKATPLKCLVFDCDGVMFDSREANRAFYNHLLAIFSLPPMTEDQLDFVHMASSSGAIEYLFKDQPVTPATVRRLNQDLDYTPFLRFMTMESDLLFFLERIRPLCITAISTNRTNTMDMLLETFNLRHCFDMVVTALDTPRPKPAPDALLMIMQEFSLAPEEILFIGDSQVDRDHSRNAGVKLIAFRNPSLEAEYHVSNFTDILDIPAVRNLLATNTTNLSP